jgi:hypothetical protein
VHPQLKAVIREFEHASERVHALMAKVSPDQWTRRPHPDRWSIGECIGHLNLTSEAYLPLVLKGLEEARRLGSPGPHRYHRDPVGWIMWRLAGPPVRFKVRTAAAFVPAGDAPPAMLVATFDRLQSEQVRCAEAGSGLPLSRVRITSPFDARVRYNLYACLTILPRHQHRHLWQAEEVLEQLTSQAEPV